MALEYADCIVLPCNWYSRYDTIKGGGSGSVVLGSVVYPFIGLTLGFTQLGNSGTRLDQVGLLNHLLSLKPFNTVQIKLLIINLITMTRKKIFWSW